MSAPAFDPDPAVRARADQEVAAINNEFLRHMEPEDREALLKFLRRDAFVTHQIHSLLDSDLPTHQAIQFLLGVAHNLRFEGARTPVVAGLLSMARPPTVKPCEGT